MISISQLSKHYNASTTCIVLENENTFESNDNNFDQCRYLQELQFS